VLVRNHDLLKVLIFLIFFILKKYALIFPNDLFHPAIRVESYVRLINYVRFYRYSADFVFFSELPFSSLDGERWIEMYIVCERFVYALV